MWGCGMETYRDTCDRGDQFDQVPISGTSTA
jgi:hypothetical protein